MGGILMAAGGAEGGLTVTLSPPNTGSGGTVGGAAGSMTAVPAGAAGPVTYAWSVVIPDPHYPLTITGAATVTAGFDFGHVAPSDVATATVRCTVSDGVNTAHADGTATFVNRSFA